MISPSQVTMGMDVKYTEYKHKLTGRVVGCVYGLDGDAKMKRDNITHLVVQHVYDVERGRDFTHATIIPIADVSRLAR